MLYGAHHGWISILTLNTAFSCYQMRSWMEQGGNISGPPTKGNEVEDMAKQWHRCSIKNHKSKMYFDDFIAAAEVFDRPKKYTSSDIWQ